MQGVLLVAINQSEIFSFFIGCPVQGGYNSAPMNSPNVSADPYISSYYTPYMSFPNQGGLNEGAWSNGGDPMSFIGGYGQVNNEYMNNNGMFSGFDYGQPGFGWGFPSGDYGSAWGANTSQQGGRKSDDRGYPANQAYYSMGPADGYGGMNGEIDRGDMGVKGVEHGLKGMSLNDKQDMGGAESMHMQGGGGQGGHAGHGSGGASSGGVSSGSGGGGGPKKTTWASIASQPARPQSQLKPKSIPRAPVLPNRHNMDIGTWDNSKNGVAKQGQASRGASGQAWSASRGGGRQAPPGPYAPGAGGSSSAAVSSTSANGVSMQQQPPPQAQPAPQPQPPQQRSSAAQSKDMPHPVLDRLRSANQYNPKEFNMAPKGARFFIIKSYSEDDIHRSIKYSIWCSTEHGNKRLDSAYREREGKGPVYLFFSVNGSGHFCGMAQMMSPVDYNASSSVWAQDKWKGQFEVKWIYVKDVPNSQLRHIRLENNENKPVTNSRDTQEVPPEKGKQVLRILHQYRHTTSIFDDFSHYEKRQEDEPVATKGKVSSLSL